ncbi:MAG: DedA family protein [Candidatus Aquicultor sp.]
MNESQIFDLLIRYFNAYGYYILFAILLFENLFLLGLVIPGETVLLVAAVFAAQGTLNIVYVMITSIVASTLGNIAGYFIGKKGGRPLIEKYGGRFVSADKIKAAERYFDEQGPKTVFIGRFAAGIRTFVPPLAGASNMGFGKFFGYSAAAIILWTLGIGLIGFFFGENWPLIKKLVGNFSLVVLALVVIFVIFYIVRRRRGGTINRDGGNKSA